MSDAAKSGSASNNSRTPRLMTVVAIATIPTLWLGWKGIASTACVLIAGVLSVFGKHRLAVGITAVVLLGHIVYPAMDGARESIHRSDCKRNLRRLTTATHDFAAFHGQIPPPYSTDENGRPLLSWRVLILPFLGYDELYDQIDKMKQMKPWDHPVNRPYHDEMPEVYSCPAIRYHSQWRATGSTTQYVVVVGDSTAWRGQDPPALTQISDGLSRTLAIIESPSHRISWMSPNEPLLASFVNEFDSSQLHNGSVLASFFDTSTTELSDNLGADEIATKLTIDDDK